MVVVFGSAEIAPDQNIPLTGLDLEIIKWGEVYLSMKNRPVAITNLHGRIVAFERRIGLR
jgi:hypothetical protein